MNSYSRHRRVSLRQPVAWLMALTLACVLLAQALGLMHGVVHGLKAPAAGHPAAGLPAATATVRPAAHWLGDIFASHQGDNDCRIYDQASHGNAAPPVAALALPVVLPSLAVTIFQGEALARWAALFDARGPPLS